MVQYLHFRILEFPLTRAWSKITTILREVETTNQETCLFQLGPTCLWEIVAVVPFLFSRYFHFFQTWGAHDLYNSFFFRGDRGGGAFAICSLFLFQKVEAPARSPPGSQKTIVFGVRCPTKMTQWRKPYWIVHGYQSNLLQRCRLTWWMQDGTGLMTRNH